MLRPTLDLIEEFRIFKLQLTSSKKAALISNAYEEHYNIRLTKKHLEQLITELTQLKNNMTEIGNL